MKDNRDHHRKSAQFFLSIVCGENLFPVKKNLSTIEVMSTKFPRHLLTKLKTTL